MNILIHLQKKKVDMKKYTLYVCWDGCGMSPRFSTHSSFQELKNLVKKEMYSDYSESIFTQIIERDLKFYSEPVGEDTHNFDINHRLYDGGDGFPATEGIMRITCRSYPDSQELKSSSKNIEYPNFY